jgi:hypothetical protein
MTNLHKIHLVFKTHLDVGFTDYARNVVAQYFERDIPQAIRLAQNLRQSNGQARFVWTTGSWLIYEYLEQATAQNRKRMEDAIVAGDITWHGLPFTTHSENMDPDLFRFGLSLSQKLDQRFNHKTIAAKMTDVPGHTRSIVPLLAEAGIRFLHIGVNPGSTPPTVPPVFVWQHTDGSDVIVMYHKGTYGDLMTVEGLDEAIAFAHTNDNLGPQSQEEIEHIFAKMQAQFPDAHITASTMDAFAARLLSVKDSLPVLTAELGDTWIHGVGTDPLKVSQYRELLRLRQNWISDGQLDPASEAYLRFNRFMLLVPEHTWGMDLKTHLLDYESYNRELFSVARNQENFRKYEASWQEQRDYIQSAVLSLPNWLKREAEQHLEALRPAAPDLSGNMQQVDVSTRFESTHFQLSFDPVTGAINHLKSLSSGTSYAGQDNVLGLFHYQTFSAADYERFCSQYNINMAKNWIWVLPDFAKPGLEESVAASQQYQPALEHLYHRQSDRGHTFIAELHMPVEAYEVYGCPRQAFIEVHLPDETSGLELQLKWFDKPANRMPEALWLTFNPKVPSPRNWMMDKLGQPISPLEIIRDGNRKLHAVNAGVYYEDTRTRLSLQTLDAPLVAPGEPSLLNFNNRQPKMACGFHFCLYNNIWGTNFPMWYDEDGFFRFTLQIEDVSKTS